MLSYVPYYWYDEMYWSTVNFCDPFMFFSFAAVHVHSLSEEGYPVANTLRGIAYPTGSSSQNQFVTAMNILRRLTSWGSLSVTPLVWEVFGRLHDVSRHVISVLTDNILDAWRFHDVSHYSFHDKFFLIRDMVWLWLCSCRLLCV